MREKEATAPVLPACLETLLANRMWWRDTVGESGGAVFRVAAAGYPDLYLKHGSGAVAQDIIDEMVRMRWLAGRLPVPRVEHFVAMGDDAWLLTAALPGLTAYQIMSDDAASHAQVAAALGRFLAGMHRLPVDECPFDSGHPLRLAHARRRMAAGEVDEADFGSEHRGWSAERLWAETTALLPLRRDPVVTHGDFSLDNILIARGAVTGCIDLGRVGIADRYQDVAILWDSLGEFGEAAQAAFAAAYGLGEIDRRKLAFHLCLDEFF